MFKNIINVHKKIAPEPPPTPTLLLGLTHGGNMKEKLLKRQLEKNAETSAIVLVPQWKSICLEQEKSSLTFEILINQLIDRLSEEHPEHILGIICDANLSLPSEPRMSDVVKTTIGLHKKVKALTLFTGTEECQAEATDWLIKSKFYFPKGTKVPDHGGILAMVLLLISQLHQANSPSSQANMTRFFSPPLHTRLTHFFSNTSTFFTIPFQTRMVHFFSMPSSNRLTNSPTISSNTASKTPSIVASSDHNLNNCTDDRTTSLEKCHSLRKSSSSFTVNEEETHSMGVGIS